MPTDGIFASADTQLDTPPGPSQGELISDEDALKLVNDTYADYDHGRKPFERQWYRNILFMLGNQWIVWDTLENKWRKKRLADWVPTPVTNKFASAGQRLVSVVARIEPNWEYAPQTDSTADIAASQMCEKAETVICEENKIEWIRQSVAPWIVYTGNVYLLSGVEPIYPPADQLQPFSPEEMAQPGDLMPSGVEGNNPPLGMPPAEEQPPMMPMQPQPVDYRLYTDVLSPFEVYKDQTIENWDSQTKILIVNRRSREYVRRVWDVDIDELDVAPNIHYQESIGYVTSAPEITGFLASLSRIKRVTVKRLFYKPDDKYPKGLYIVVAGSKVLEKKELPVNNKGEGFVPVAHMKFDNIPGASNGRTPMDDVVYKQIQRNKIESMIELIALRMASPVWLMPEGTVMRNFTGAPGAIINYSMVGDKATRPDRIPGEQIPTSIVQFLASIDKDIEDLVSTFEALKGQSPYSGAPGVVIEQLIEQGLTRFGPSLRNIAEGYRLWMKHQLELFRIYGVAEKTIMKQGEGSTWVADRFKGADIEGAVDIKVESDSTIPRSSQVEVAKILEAVNSGLVDVTNPTVRQKVLQKLKIQDLQDDVESDLLAAVQENERIAQGDSTVDVVAFLDNHAMHIYKHKQFANSEQGRQFIPVIMQHVAKHVMIMDAEANPGVPMPAPGAPSGGPGANVSPEGSKTMAPQGTVPGAGEVPQGVQ
jgi:hypothetical protein